MLWLTCLSACDDQPATDAASKPRMEHVHKQMVLCVLNNNHLKVTANNASYPIPPEVAKDIAEYMSSVRQDTAHALLIVSDSLDKQGVPVETVIAGYPEMKPMQPMQPLQ